MTVVRLSLPADLVHVEAGGDVGVRAILQQRALVLRLLGRSVGVLVHVLRGQAALAQLRWGEGGWVGGWVGGGRTGGWWVHAQSLEDS